ncbi:MAG: internal scaffolding protein [Microvirus sp.]|nr:MAG: internal scaffolding protein [Microvirus sp.]
MTNTPLDQKLRSPLPSKKGPVGPAPQTNVNADGVITIPDNNYENKFIHAYGPKLRVRISFPEQGITKQEFKNECDINIIMKQFERTGVITHMNNNGAPRYLEVGGTDFQDAMQTVAAARETFDGLPSKIRDRFDNSPQKFLDFFQDPKNAQEGVELGLLEPPATPPATTLQAPPQNPPKGD